MQKTDAQLITEAEIIKNETERGANTAQRIGDMLINVIDSKVNNDSRPYKVFTAIVSQTAGNDPVVNVLENTIDNISIIRNETGIYFIQSESNSFTTDKTFTNNPVYYYDNFNNRYYLITITPNSENQIFLKTFEIDGSYQNADNVLSNYNLEIRVYN